MNGRRLVVDFPIPAGSVVVPPVVAAVLAERLDLDGLRVELRGVNPIVDQALLDLHATALVWRERQRAASGTNSAAQGAPTARSQWESTPAVAARTGLAERTVRNAAAKGQLPGRQVDGRWHYVPTDVDEWISRRLA